MRTEPHRGAVLVAGLALAALACGLPIDLPFLPGEEEAAPPSEVESQPAELPPPTDGSAGALESSGGPELLDLDDPATYQEPIELVNSYRVAMSFRFDGVAADGSPVSGHVQGEGQRRLNPEAVSMSFSGDGPGGLSGELPVAFSLSDGLYTIYSPETGCINLPAGELDNPFELLIDTGGFLTGQAPRVRPDETVNGVEAYRFSIDSSNVDSSELEVDEIESGMIYVARDGGYVVRLEISGRGTSEMLSGDPALVGDVRYRLDYSDFNQPMEIVAPEGCEATAGSTESEFPVVEDATELISFGGIVSYNSQMAFEAVVQFYKDQMPAQGWTLTDETSLGGLALLTFNGPDGEALVTVTDDESTGQVQVTILPTSE